MRAPAPFDEQSQRLGGCRASQEGRVVDHAPGGVRREPAVKMAFAGSSPADESRETNAERLNDPLFRRIGAEFELIVHVMDDAAAMVADGRHARLDPTPLSKRSKSRGRTLLHAARALRTLGWNSDRGHPRPVGLGARRFAERNRNDLIVMGTRTHGYPACFWWPTERS